MKGSVKFVAGLLFFSAGAIFSLWIVASGLIHGEILFPMRRVGFVPLSANPIGFYVCVVLWFGIASFCSWLVALILRDSRST